mgnify:CR=1 FL=1
MRSDMPQVLQPHKNIEKFFNCHTPKIEVISILCFVVAPLILAVINVMLRRRLANNDGNHYKYDVSQRSGTIETLRGLQTLKGKL